MKSLSVSRLLLFGGLALSLLVLALSWDLPLLEYRSFRQTQTAISSYWMATSTDWLAYPTPVLGHPWSIPFEFPLYQALALAAANILPITLDQAGRLVSWLFAVLTVIPLRQCVKGITGREELADTFAAFFLLSPLYLFGARCFLIESTTLFFSVTFLAAMVKFWKSPSPGLFLLMFSAATLAALVKITTFFGFGVAALAFMIWKSASGRGAWELRFMASRHAPVAVAVLGAIVITAIYIHFSDLRKAETVWGAGLASGNLGTWNYGSWEQKTSARLWMDVVLGRASREILGSVLLLPLAAALVLFFGRGLRLFGACLLAGYAIPFLMFANLHQVHGYYQHANGIFLVGLLACSVEALRTRFGRVASVVAVLCFAAVMLLGFRRDFLPFISTPKFDERTLALASFARSETEPGDVLLIFGQDWSSAVPYYATRRAMMVKDTVSADVLRGMRENPASYSGAFPVGLVIVCPNQLAERPGTAAEYHRLVEAVSAGRTRYRISGCDLFR